MGPVQNLAAQPPRAQSVEPHLSSVDLGAEIVSAISSGDLQKLSALLKRQDVDLAAVVDGRGQGVLHSAVSSANDDITLLLLQHAKGVSSILNALSPEGGTVVMRAEALGNTRLVRALVDAGAVAERHHLGQEPGVSRKPIFPAAGDVSTSFDAAVMRADLRSAQWYFDDGVDTLPTLRRCISEHRWATLVSMIKNKLVHGEDVLAVLQNAVDTDNHEAVTLLIHPQIALAALAAMAAQPRQAKLEALQRFVAAGATPASLVIEGARRAASTTDGGASHELEVLQILIAHGAPTAIALYEQSDLGHRRVVSEMIGFGALATLEVYRYFRHEGRDDAAELIVHGLLDWTLKINLVEDERVLSLQRYAKLGLAAAGTVLLERVVAGDLDAVRFLIAAGVPTTEVLIELGKTDQWTSAAQMIQLGAEGASAISWLRQLIAHHEAQGDQAAAMVVQEVADKMTALLAA